MNNATPATRKIRLWDLPLRLFHWALLLAVAGAVMTAELGDEISGAMDWHPRLGYAVLTLLLFRLIWGFVGGTHARFASFVRGPSEVVSYLRLFKTKTAASIGHNPLGALSVMALLLSLFIQAGSGLFLGDEDFGIEGPLFKHVSSETVRLFWKIHEINKGVLIALVALHILAILFYRVIKRENLITPMITGQKEISTDQPASDAQGGHWLAGLIVFALAAAAIWWVVTQV